MKKPLVTGGIILTIAFLGMGFLFHSDCKKDCDKQPAYWYSIAMPQVYYSSLYHTSNTGGPIEEPEDVPRTSPSQPHEEPPLEEEPQISVPGEE